MTWSNAGWGGDGGWYKSAAGNSDAAQTTAFLARTSGLSGTETAAYKALINGLVSDGDFAALDCLYITATNTTTTANLNLISTSFPLVSHGGITFSADHGYTGDGTTGYLDTGFNPSTAGGAYALNSATIAAYLLNSRTTALDMTSIGIRDGSNVSWIIPNRAGNNCAYDMNDPVSLPTVANANSQGLLVNSRTTAALISVYRNGNTTPLATTTTASNGIPNTTANLLADLGGGERFSTDQIAAAFIGGGMTAAQMARVAGRINAYMTALSVNVY